MRDSGEQAHGARRADGRRRGRGRARVGALGRASGLGRAGKHRRSDTGPLITRRDHVPERPRRGLPAPSPSALVGLAVLVLIAFGAIHLSGSGTAVPLEDPPGEVVLEPGQGDGATGEGGGTSGSDARAAEGTGGADGSSGTARSGTAGGSTSEGSAADGSAPPQGGATQGGAAQDGTTQDGASSPAELVVHVSGAVAEPGVVRLPAGARVDDALRAAGGASEDADLAAVNLARPVADGEQIHVPRPGEDPPAVVAPPGTATSPPGSAPDGAGDGGAGGLIDLNTADAAALEELPGVGPAIAARIIEHREKNGPFTSVDDLLEVSGIGPATLEKLRAQATV